MRPALPALALLSGLLLLSRARAQTFAACVGANSSATLRTPGQPDFGYHVSRSLHPSPVPRALAEVYSVADVQAVVRCAAQYGVAVCPRSGGHSFVGSSLCQGVSVDLRKMDWVSVDGKQVTMALGATLGDLFYRVLEQSGGKRMIGVGLCPSVGTGGYVLGGGHNPYAGLTGLTCDSLGQVKVVRPDGELVTANAGENAELFWASCGGGGGAFGIAVEATLNTHKADVFNRHVSFRFTWPKASAGKVVAGWMDWDQDAGQSWLRLEMNVGSDLQGYGVCWNVDSKAECVNRLSKQAWFNTPGRKTSLLAKGTRAQQFQTFIGPAGAWGTKVYEGADADALTGKRDLDAGNGPNRLYSSSFLSWPGGNKPSVAVMQKMVESAAAIDGSLVEWVVLQFNPWKGGVQKGQNNAFAHRGSGAFIELIGQSQSGEAGLGELKRVQGEVKALSRSWLSGIYVSYPEFGLGQQDWQYLYWGQSLQRLAYLKGNMDPTGRMARLQQLPAGKLGCPGKLAVTAAGNKRTIAITGYGIGQMAGMVTVFSVKGGCGVKLEASKGADVVAEGSNFSASVHSNSPFTITLTGSNVKSCTVQTVQVNSISC